MSEAIESGVVDCGECVRLNEINADLLAACETVLEQEEAKLEGGRLLRRDTILKLLREAIAKARTP